MRPQHTIVIETTAPVRSKETFKISCSLAEDMRVKRLVVDEPKLNALVPFMVDLIACRTHLLRKNEHDAPAPVSARDYYASAKVPGHVENVLVQAGSAIVLHATNPSELARPFRAIVVLEGWSK